jgi:hypothetical protein
MDRAFRQEGLKFAAGMLVKAGTLQPFLLTRDSA